MLHLAEADALESKFAFFQSPCLEIYLNCWETLVDQNCASVCFLCFDLVGLSAEESKAWKNGKIDGGLQKRRKNP